MNVSIAPMSVGFLIALLALILVVVLMITGAIPLVWTGVILAMLAISRLC